MPASDVNNEECLRQSLVVRDDPQEDEIADWLEAAADTEGWALDEGRAGKAAG